MWRSRRDKRYEDPELMGQENKSPHKDNIEDYLEEAYARLDIHL